MSDKHLSGEEKRAKMKEEFKKDLRKRKEFLEKAKRLRQLKRINQALENMGYSDDTDELIRQLDEETAFNEAKLELATESARTINVPIEGPDGEIDPPVPQPSEEELQRLAAEELVRQMKAEMMGEAETGVENPVEVDISSESDAQTENEVSIGEDSPTAEVDESSDDDDDRPFRKMMDDIT